MDMNEKPDDCDQRELLMANESVSSSDEFMLFIFASPLQTRVRVAVDCSMSTSKRQCDVIAAAPLMHNSVLLVSQREHIFAISPDQLIYTL